MFLNTFCVVQCVSDPVSNKGCHVFLDCQAQDVSTLFRGDLTAGDQAGHTIILSK